MRKQTVHTKGIGSVSPGPVTPVEITPLHSVSMGLLFIRKILIQTDLSIAPPLVSDPRAKLNEARVLLNQTERELILSRMEEELKANRTLVGEEFYYWLVAYAFLKKHNLPSASSKIKAKDIAYLAVLKHKTMALSPDIVNRTYFLMDAIADAMYSADKDGALEFCKIYTTTRSSQHAVSLVDSTLTLLFSFQHVDKKKIDVDTPTANAAIIFGWHVDQIDSLWADIRAAKSRPLSPANMWLEAANVADMQRSLPDFESMEGSIYNRLLKKTAFDFRPVSYSGGPDRPQQSVATIPNVTFSFNKRRRLPLNKGITLDMVKAYSAKSNTVKGLIQVQGNWVYMDDARYNPYLKDKLDNLVGGWEMKSNDSSAETAIVATVAGDVASWLLNKGIKGMEKGAATAVVAEAATIFGIEIGLLESLIPLLMLI